jgi:hypothetical protein
VFPAIEHLLALGCRRDGRIGQLAGLFVVVVPHVRVRQSGHQIDVLRVLFQFGFQFGNRRRLPVLQLYRVGLEIGFQQLGYVGLVLQLERGLLDPAGDPQGRRRVRPGLVCVEHLRHRRLAVGLHQELDVDVALAVGEGPLVLVLRTDEPEHHGVESEQRIRPLGI